MEDTPPFLRLPEDTIADILIRLPAKYLLRSGAACKAWRRITTTPHFLAARARRRQPASILAHTYLDAAPWTCGEDLLAGFSSEDVAVEALPVASPDEDRQRLIRYPGTRLTVPAHCGRLLASCDGVLLFKKETGLYLLCNPVTRQWAELRLPDEYCKDRDPEYAFYLHRPSGEFRLLCCLQHRVWYVVSTGAAQPRHLKVNPEPDLITRFIRSLLTTTTIPVALNDSLHWPPLWRSTAGETRITAFNTVSETFNQLLSGPTSRKPSALRLFEMGGMLAAADFLEEKHVDLWFLEDYEAGRWECRYRVFSPWTHGKGRPLNHWGMHSVAAAGDDEGNVILGNNDGLVVYNVRRKEMVRTVDSVMQRKNRVFVSRHVFKGSLVQHAGFVAPPSSNFPLIHSWS